MDAGSSQPAGKNAQATSPVVFFVDLGAPLTYDAAVATEVPTGGTVFATVQVAEQLAQHRPVYVLERDQGTNSGTAEYVGIARAHELPAPDVVVLIRYPLTNGNWSVDSIARRFPRARLIHWHHLTVRFPKTLQKLKHRKERKYWQHHQALVEAWLRHKMDVVVTSEFHRRNIYGLLRRVNRGIQRIRVTAIYNPLDPRSFPPPEGDFDADRMVYFSNPERGLTRAIHTMKHLRRNWPSLRLSVAAPGYSTLKDRVPDGVEVLGQLPRSQLYASVARSLCTFYPNLATPECFGYVFAESNALGVPVLTPDLGAASEILDPRQPLTDCRSLRLIAKRIDEWRDGRRPIVGLKPEVAIERVGAAWAREISGESKATL